jgi:squalene-hopene/tetraprenyl-beta-curcumene cyclase
VTLDEALTPDAGPGEAREKFDTDAELVEGLARAAGHLRSLQREDGHWKGELVTNVTMDAEDILMRHFLGISTAEQLEQSARWIRSQQTSDGSWNDFPGGPGSLSTTVEAWVALRYAGDAADAPHMARAAAWIRAHGGVEGARVFTHMWLSMVGLWSWDDCPTLPPEIMYLPKWFPLNIYDWGCWARQTIVALSIVSTERPVKKVWFGIEEIRTGAAKQRNDPLWTVAGVFQRLDVGLRLYGRLAPRHNPVRRLAMRQAAEWILARQEADGGWGGIQPPLVYSIIALRLMGYAVDHPAVKAGLAAVERFTVRKETPEGPIRWVEACQSPVWDTGLSLAALLEAGVPGDDPAVLRAADWLLDEQIDADGDWQVRRPALPSGGWAFEYDNDVYPDTDDTAEIVLALRRVDHPDLPRLCGALDRAVVWTRGMQSRDGGWGAFDADNTRTLTNAIPFCDFGEVIDPPSADVTAHVVEMLAVEGMADGEACRRGVAWLLDHQERDGSWFGRWGANHLYGTGAAVPALVEAGLGTDHPAIRAAVAWLEDHQNADGGWGEDLRSYADPAWRGHGASTPSQTAWALLALIAAGEADPGADGGTGPTPAVRRGVEHLLATQRADGGWDEVHFTGTGFPGDFYIGYQMYRLVFPIWALGRYARRLGLLPTAEAS